MQRITKTRKVAIDDIRDLPGADLVLAGLSELKYGEPTECGLLVLIAAPRLSRLGIEVPDRRDIPRPVEHRLYELLELTRGASAFSYYNSLLRRMASFAAALEHCVR